MRSGKALLYIPCFEICRYDQANSIVKAGPHLAHFWHQVVMICISTYTNINLILRYHNLSLTRRFQPVILEIYFPLNSCHIQTIRHWSLVPAMAKFESLTLSILVILPPHLGGRIQPQQEGAQT